MTHSKEFNIYSTNNRLFLRRVFPSNQLHWYRKQTLKWPQNTQTQKLIVTQANSPESWKMQKKTQGRILNWNAHSESYQSCIYSRLTWVKTGHEQSQMVLHSIHCSFPFCTVHNIHTTRSNQANLILYQQFNLVSVILHILMYTVSPPKVQLLFF